MNSNSQYLLEKQEVSEESILKPVGYRLTYHNLMIEAESIGSDNPEGPPLGSDEDSDYQLIKKPRFQTNVFTFPHLETLQAH